MDLDEHRYRRGYHPKHWEMEDMYENPVRSNDFYPAGETDHDAAFESEIPEQL